MRKPALVVTVAVSAVLAGGIMVTTAAVAEEPTAPQTVPSAALPSPPQLPGDTGVPAVAGLPAVPEDPPAGTGPATPATSAVVATRSRAAADPDRPEADEPATARAATTAARPAAAAATRPVSASPSAARPGVKAEGRARARPAADQPARTVKVKAFSAARRGVTAGQALSADPRGPVQQQALTLINESRRRGGCESLTVDRRLIAAANRHAAEMARRGYFAHEDARGQQAGDRVQDAGYRWSRYGENIARGQGSVAEVVKGWMTSPAHRENIMNCGLREVGLGLAFSPDRTPYWVQDLATPK